MKITMIGHSTLLIESEGKRILTDPYFSRWGNPAFSRTEAAAKTREELKEIDLVLVSHDHWDHTDANYFKSIGNTPLLAPRLAYGMLKLMGAQNVISVSPWEVLEAGGVKVSVVPAVHVTATVGFVIHSEGKQIFFAGDTFYNGFMKVMPEKFQLDAALLPVFTYRLPMTMNNSDAIKAVKTLKPSVVLPIHSGIKPRLPLMRTGESAESFAAKFNESGIPARVVILQNNESYSL